LSKLEKRGPHQIEPAVIRNLKDGIGILERDDPFQGKPTRLGSPSCELDIMIIAEGAETGNQVASPRARQTANSFTEYPIYRTRIGPFA
jgi:hypothetical protein